jgi:hypothetical protein
VAEPWTVQMSESNGDAANLAFYEANAKAYAERKRGLKALLTAIG